MIAKTPVCGGAGEIQPGGIDPSRVSVYVDAVGVLG
jgi:hypothetical protein